MKNKFIRIVLFISSSIMASTGYSQTSTGLALDPGSIIRAETAAADMNTLSEMKTASEKMYRQFTKTFAKASNITVFPSKRCFEVYCKVDGINNKILYSKNGRFIHNVRNYDHSKLPEIVSEAVLDYYPRYTIFGGVAEVWVMGKVAYFVMIQNKNSWKRVKVLDGEIEVFEEYAKN
jgi:hypothetical protein